MGKLEDLERRIEELERGMERMSNPYPYQPPQIPYRGWKLGEPTCPCPPNSACGNAACPRRLIATCQTTAA